MQKFTKDGLIKDVEYDFFKLLKISETLKGTEFKDTQIKRLKILFDYWMECAEKSSSLDEYFVTCSKLIPGKKIEIDKKHASIRKFAGRFNKNLIPKYFDYCEKKHLLPRVGFELKSIKSGAKCKLIALLHDGDDVSDVAEHVRSLSGKYQLVRSAKDDYDVFDSAESVLKKKKVSEVEKFRKKGPFYSDITEGNWLFNNEKFILSIIEDIKENEIFILTGPPASGKTVTARLVSKEWMKKHPVMFLNGKEKKHELSISKLKEDTKKLNKKSSDALLIIEDAHLVAEIINKFVEYFDDSQYSMFVLIVARDNFNDNLPQYIHNNLESDKRKIKVLRDQSREIIKDYFDKQDWEKTEDIEKKIIRKSKGNLWILSYALRSLADSEGKAINEDFIVTEVIKDLEAIGRNDSLYPRLLIALSFLYREEISTDVRYLYEIFPELPSVIDNAMNNLCEMGEVVMIQQRYHTLFGLPHSSLADFYFQFFHNSKWECDEDEDNFIWSYLISKKSSNWVHLFMFGREMRIQLIRILKSRQDIYLLVNKIGSLDLRIFSVVLGFFSHSAKEVGEKLFENMYPDKLVKRIDESDDLSSVGIFILYVFMASQKVGKGLWTNIKDKLVKRIDESDDLSSVMNFIGDISFASQKIGKELCEEIDPDKLVKKIDEFDNLSSVGNFIYQISYVSHKLVKELCEKIDPGELAEKINKSDNIDDSNISFFVHQIFYKSPKIGVELLNKIDLDKLDKKIDPNKLVEEIDPDKLAEEINESDDINDAVILIRVYNTFVESPKTGKKLWEEIKQKLEKRIK